MRIKSGIRKSYPKTCIVIESSPDIYIADMRLRSQNERGVEVSSFLQQSPDGKGDMDSVHLDNPELLSMDFAIFDDNQFKRADGRDDIHCEGCFYPTLSDPQSWMAFLEIKDCKPRNYSEYKRHAKRQIFQSVKAFFQKGIIKEEKIYGIISIPRKHTEFNDTLFVDSVEIRRLKHFTGIRYYGSNEVLIMDDMRIRPLDI